MCRHLSQVDVNSLIEVECGTLDVTTKRSGILHTNVGLGLFAARSFGTAESIGLYYGTLKYSNLVNEKEKWMASGEGIMSVTVQTVPK